MKLARIFLNIPSKLIRFLNKSKFDNFVGGIVFGALFTIFLNLINFQIQEVIQRQKIFESLENELVGHAITSKNVLDKVEEKRKTNSMPNYFDYTNYYSDNFWNNTESIKYIVQLDPELQGLLVTYYEIVVKQSNAALLKNEQLKDDFLKDCYQGISKNLRLDIESCKEEYKTFLGNEESTAINMGTNSLDILKKFHPTQDRLNNPFLRFMLGDKSVRVLSGH